MKKIGRFGMATILLWSTSVLASACANEPGPIRACAIEPNAEIGDCPKGCYPVQGRLVGAMVDCPLEPPILGCADRPWTSSAAPDITEAPGQVISAEDGHRYSLAQEYRFWRESEWEQPWFCESESDPKCPERDPAIRDACQVR